MACRKDGKGRVLRKGEGYRKGDGRYSYVYVDPLGKKRTIYAKSLVKLREREEQLKKDQLDGLDVYVAGKADVNFLFDRYISTKTELRSTTYSNYLYTWNHFASSSLTSSTRCSEKSFQAASSASIKRFGPPLVMIHLARRRSKM